MNFFVSYLPEGGPVRSRPVRSGPVRSGPVQSGPVRLPRYIGSPSPVLHSVRIADGQLCYVHISSRSTHTGLNCSLPNKFSLLEATNSTPD